MNIKIISTEKKLTKSIINQMHSASIQVLEKGKTLGYVNIFGSVLLIEYEGRYYRQNMGWYKWEDSPRASRKVGKFSQSTNPNQSEEEFARWWYAYCKLRDEAEQIYI